VRIRHSHSAIPWQGQVLCRRALISSGQAADFCDQRPAGVLFGDDVIGSGQAVSSGEGLKAVRDVALAC